MKKWLAGMKKEMVLYFIIISVVALGLGLSDSVFGNYFKDAYQVDAQTRGFIEFPRELPGILGMFIIAALSMLGDIRLAVLAQVLSFVGLLVLGLFTPPFAVMLIFLFINSLGMHLFMPLADGIGLGIIDDKDAVGKRMGQYNGVRTAFGMLSAIIVFVGFRTGFFSFTSPVKWIFLIGALLLLAAALLLLSMHRKTGQKEIYARKITFLFRKEYKLYYMLATMHGAQKQIMYVYAPWVLIELLGQGADTMALLAIVGSFIGIFFMPFVGRCIDRFGVRKMLFTEALSFIIIYITYGFLSGGIYSGSFATTGFGAGIVIAVFIIDRMSTQLGMVKVLYLNSIAVDKADVTRTLSTGISLDHIVSITCASLGGMVWKSMGPQYVFFIAAGLSLVNLVVAYLVKPSVEKKDIEIT